MGGLVDGHVDGGPVGAKARLPRRAHPGHPAHRM